MFFNNNRHTLANLIVMPIKCYSEWVNWFSLNHPSILVFYVYLLRFALQEKSHDKDVCKSSCPKANVVVRSSHIQDVCVGFIY